MNPIHQTYKYLIPCELCGTTGLRNDLQAYWCLGHRGDLRALDEDHRAWECACGETVYRHYRYKGFPFVKCFDCKKASARERTKRQLSYILKRAWKKGKKRAIIQERSN